jgi:hypothetical protein
MIITSIEHEFVVKFQIVESATPDLNVMESSLFCPLCCVLSALPSSPYWVHLGAAEPNIMGWGLIIPLYMRPRFSNLFISFEPNYRIVHHDLKPSTKSISSTKSTSLRLVSHNSKTLGKIHTTVTHTRKPPFETPLQ